MADNKKATRREVRAEPDRRIALAERVAEHVLSEHASCFAEARRAMTQRNSEGDP